MNIFRELSLQVHPDIAGNNPVNNDGFARQWGIPIEGISHVHIVDPYEGVLAFRTFFDSIFILENRMIPTANKNVRIKNILNRKPENQVSNKFRSLLLIPNYNYDYNIEHTNIRVLLRNRTIFKIVELKRTTAKCLYGTDIHTKETKRYNVSSLLGRQVIRKEENWKWS